MVQLVSRDVGIRFFFFFKWRADSPSRSAADVEMHDLRVGTCRLIRPRKPVIHACLRAARRAARCRIRAACVGVGLPQVVVDPTAPWTVG